jgi:hypothetical protein
MTKCVARPFCFPCCSTASKAPEAGVAGGGEDHVRAFADLGQREFFAFAGIVPRESVTPT